MSEDVITLGGLDVAKARDYAAIAVGQVVYPEIQPPSLRVLGVRPFEHQPYTQLEGEVARIYNNRGLCKLTVDATNEKSFAERLQLIGLNVEPLHFTAGLKHDMIGYVLQLRAQNRLAIPETGPFIIELRRQMSEQEKILTTATIRYDHPSDQHDDLLWALCLLAYGAKPWLEGLVDYRVYPVHRHR